MQKGVKLVNPRLLIVTDERAVLYKAAGIATMSLRDHTELWRSNPYEYLILVTVNMQAMKTCSKDRQRVVESVS